MPIINPTLKIANFGPNNLVKPKETAVSKIIAIEINNTLFAWVVENIIKNGIDAMKGKGEINIDINKNEKYTTISIMDNGPGLEKGINNEIFQPGYTTKKRGWGLGLSLAKRIIENYHKGKLQIRTNKKTKGLNLCIILKSY